VGINIGSRICSLTQSQFDHREQNVMEEDRQTVVKGENERRITLLRFIIQTLTDTVRHPLNDCDRYLDKKWHLPDSKEEQEMIDRIAKEMHSICKYYAQYFDNGWKETMIEDWY
jgi:hypothetical protein